VKQEHLDEIGKYLSFFQEGFKSHNQEHYHSPDKESCKTAHCLAGWKTYDDAIAAGVQIEWKEYPAKDGYSPYLVSDQLNKFVFEQVPGTEEGGEERYARYKWELTQTEGDILFESHLSLEEMKENLQLIAKRHELQCSILENAQNE
jgi:DMSO/TMAO reductase YedYZ molybdopterin-dependent catalytic subunit